MKSRVVLQKLIGTCHGQGRNSRAFPLRIDSTIEVLPHLFHFHIGLINAPRVVRHYEMGRASFLLFCRVVLYPMVARGVIDVQSPLKHHLLQVSVTERIPQEVSGYRAKSSQLGSDAI